jgi:hypothetical protein
MSTRPSHDPYESARDLPSVPEAVEQVKGLKTLTRFVARGQGSEVLELERRVLALAQRIDRFYALLGPRTWIYHDSLHEERVGALLDLPADDAEAGLIGLYRDPEWLRFMIGQLRRLDASRLRAELIEKAEADYQADRFYSATLVLLAVMDGFVNDVQPERRRGLHARDADELAAWDSVVGHHMGLTHAHKAFTKSTFKTSIDPVYELHRNGIVHGTLVNFDNVVVATKAWNRLFAVGDWAASLERSQREPPEAPTTWRDLLEQSGANERAKKSLAPFRPRVVEADDPALFEEDASSRARDFLAAWTAKNFGRMAAFVSPRAMSGTTQQMAGTLRETFSLHELHDSRLVRADRQAAAACEIDVELTFDTDVESARMRWIRETEDGSPAIREVDAEWFLYVWDPWTMIGRAR